MWITKNCCCLSYMCLIYKFLLRSEDCYISLWSLTQVRSLNTWNSIARMKSRRSLSFAKIFFSFITASALFKYCAVYGSSFRKRELVFFVARTKKVLQFINQRIIKLVCRRTGYSSLSTWGFVEASATIFFNF